MKCPHCGEEAKELNHRKNKVLIFCVYCRKHSVITVDKEDDHYTKLELVS